MKYVKPDHVRTEAHAQRSQKTGASYAVAGLVTREKPVMALVSSVLLEFAMKDVVRISAMVDLDVSVRLVTLGRGVSKVCSSEH